MASGIYIATSGAVAQSKALDVVSNNVANASTSGYKAMRVGFAKALGVAQSPDSTFVGVGRVAADPAMGALKSTGNPLDLAIAGDGYFALQTPRGVRYTRSGNFRLDASRQLVAANGTPVRGASGGTITVPGESSRVAVARDGAVSADGVQVGKIDIATFAPSSLRREGGSSYIATGPRTGGASGDVVSGSIEQSNVNVVRGVVDLVRVSRAYEALSKIIQTYQQIESRTARSLGGPK